LILNEEYAQQEDITLNYYVLVLYVRLLLSVRSAVSKNKISYL